MKLTSIVVALTLALGAAACREGSATVAVITSRQPVVSATDPAALPLARGAAIAVQPYMIRSEVEGTTALPITDVRADDSSIVEVLNASRSYGGESSSPNGRTWVIVGVAQGTATLRLYRDGDELDTYLVEVVEQAE